MSGITKRVLQIATAAGAVVVAFLTAAATPQTKTNTPPAPIQAPAPTAVVTPPPAPVLKDVQLHVQVIKAQKSGRIIDWRVRSIEKLIRPLFNFSSYRLVREDKLTIVPNVKKKLEMPFRKSVVVTNRGIVDKKVKLRLKVGRKAGLTLMLDDGGHYLQGLSFKVRDRYEHYILKISVKSL